MRYLPSILLALSVLPMPGALAQDRSGGTRAPWGDNPWVKLCETLAAPGRDHFGRDTAAGVKTCLIHHEQLDRTSGALVMAAAVRQAGKRETLMVVMPAGVHLVPGVRAFIYPADLWARVQRRERLQPADATRIRTLTLKYIGCRATGCIAETGAGARLVADLKSKAGMVVSAWRNGQTIAFGISLKGFSAAYDGPPVDSVQFRAAKAELLRRLRERHAPRVQPQRRDDQDI